MTPENTDINLPNLPNIPKKEPKLQQKTLQAMRLVQAGFSPLEALQATNQKEKIAERTVYKLKENCKKHSLTEPSTVKLAYKQIRRILQAEAREVVQQKMSKDGQVVEITAQIVPTDSNILAAAGMVYDRYEPVQSQEPAAGGGNTYIDLSSYRVELSTGSDKPVSDSQVVDMVED